MFAILCLILLKSQPSLFQETTKEYFTPETRSEKPIFDFIVVGSGSAGAALANRLSEVPEWNILLLETGEPAGSAESIPPLFAPILQLTSLNWKYFMEYDPGFARGMNNRRLAWPRGKALGGTTIINYMIYTRGHPEDYDRWAAQGNPGWSYKEILPYFLKSENATLRNGDPRYHNQSGYLSVEDVYQSELVKAFVEAGEEMGYKNIDYSTDEIIGFSTVQANTQKGLRHSVDKAFLEPIKARKNLFTLTSAHVTRVLIDPKKKNAFGVEFVLQNLKYKAYVSKEVVLSAGAFNSPQLLMLSGIGPKKHLEELEIPHIQDLPVGQNLHDHITFVGLTFLIKQPLSYSILNTLRGMGVTNWLLNGKGPLTSLGGVEGLAYINTNVTKEPFGYPDIELIFVGGGMQADFGMVNYKTMNIRRSIYDTLWKPIENAHSWTIFPMLLHPKSTGHLRLRTKNPFDVPLFYGHYFSDEGEEDMRSMIAAIRFIMELGKTQPFQKIGTTFHDTPIPGCTEFLYNSDDYWRCALRTLSITLHHQLGTCKMGPVADPTTVVDHELKVHGVGNLRVADTSVIPFALSAHTNAPSIMIGEKTADIIKKTWLKT